MLFVICVFHGEAETQTGTDARTHARIHRLTDRQTDTHKHRHTDRQRDAQTDRRRESCTAICSVWVAVITSQTGIIIWVLMISAIKIRDVFGVGGGG